jgi:hypothetical protein
VVQQALAEVLDGVVKRNVCHGQVSAQQVGSLLLQLLRQVGEVVDELARRVLFAGLLEGFGVRDVARHTAGDVAQGVQDLVHKQCLQRIFGVELRELCRISCNGNALGYNASVRESKDRQGTERNVLRATGGASSFGQLLKRDLLVLKFDVGDAEASANGVGTTLGEDAKHGN